MYEIKATGRFKRDLKVIVKRGYNITLLSEVVTVLALGQPLHQKHKDHSLSGNWKNHRECHITPDWFLIYKIEADYLVLTLTRTGTTATFSEL